ncbi:DUF4160 domain-containing protein [Brevundimonas sp.]
MNAHQPIQQAPSEEIDLFEMSNLYPKHTGLPMTVWVGVKGGARHDVRVKVCRTHGNHMDIHDTAVVSVRPTPELIEGPLPTADLRAVQAWIELNADVIIGHWDGVLDTVDLAQGLKRI